MHNWWIASLEHFGLITREEAEHIANNIKNSIHKDNYVEAYRELEAILGAAKFDSTTTIQKLQDRVNQLEAKVQNLSDSLQRGQDANKKAPAVPAPAKETPPLAPPTGVEKTLANAAKA